MQGPSQSSILELKAIAAEHADRFKADGRKSSKGTKRPLKADPFDRPNPGLVKRLAAEARNDAKRRHFDDNGAGPSDEQRRLILERKAEKYERLKRGDYSGMTDKEMAEAVIDFDRGREGSSEESSEDGDSSERIEYMDDLGRTRIGTRAEAKANGAAPQPQRREDDGSSYAEVMQSKVIHGDQNFFPVYEPDPDAIRAKYREAEEEGRQHHYDANKEVRTRGAGLYQFSLDEDERARQMSSLKAQREETERARQRVHTALDRRNTQLDARRAMIEAKREEKAGGREALQRLRDERRAAEADDLLQELENEIKREPTGLAV